MLQGNRVEIQPPHFSLFSFSPKQNFQILNFPLFKFRKRCTSPPSIKRTHNTSHSWWIYHSMELGQPYARKIQWDDLLTTLLRWTDYRLFLAADFGNWPGFANCKISRVKMCTRLCFLGLFFFLRVVFAVCSRVCLCWTHTRHFFLGARPPQQFICEESCTSLFLVFGFARWGFLCVGEIWTSLPQRAVWCTFVPGHVLVD